MIRPDFTTRAYPVVEVAEVHDGDTYKLLLDRGGEDLWAPWLRLRNYSAPELHDAGGTAAQQTAAALLTAFGTTLWVVTHRAARPFKVRRYIEDDKSFGRYLADVWLDDDKPLGGELVRLGAARAGAFEG